MANYITRLGRNASNAAQWGTKAGKLLGAAEIDYVSTELTNRFSPAAFDVTRATTATRVNPSGLIESVQANVPRICYLNDAKGELLVEPQRTNLLRYSEQFDNAAYTKTNSTITANAIAAPDGTTTADKLIADATNNFHWVEQQITSTGGSTYAISVFAQAAEYDYLYIQGTTLSEAGVWFNLSTGSIETSVGTTLASSRIENYGSGIYKCSIVFAGAAANQIIRFGVSNADNVRTFTGDATSGIYIWGGQAESGSYATSYIKTEATTQTRNADVISLTGASALLGDSEGALFVEASVFDTTTSKVISLSDGTTNKRHLINFTAAANFNAFTTNSASGGTQASIFGGSYVANTFYKVAARYATNNFTAYLDGSNIGTDTSGVTFSSGDLTRMGLDTGDGTVPFYGRIRQLVVFDQALTNDELAAITT